MTLWEMHEQYERERQENFEKLNKQIREILDDYYQKHDADNFFRIDQILQVCIKQGWTKDQIPALIEMKNVILMG